MDLTTVTMQNPWWKNKSEILKDDKVKKALETKPEHVYTFKNENIILLGPRQVGKTTYIKLVIMDLLINKNINPRNILYLTCDFIDSKEDIKNALTFFDEQSDKKNTRYIFLDEISFVKDWNTLILGLFNSGYLKDKRIYLTGSSSISLLKETFPGRDILKIVFLPMQFREYFDLFYDKIDCNTEINLEDMENFYKSAQNLIPYIDNLNIALNNYLLSGGFLWPSYLLENSDPLSQLFEIYKDALLSDISKLEKNQKYFKAIMDQIITGYSSRLSANSIAKTASIGSHKTVENYLEIMEGLFIIKIFYKKLNGKIMYRSNKKIYFTDPFIYRVMKFYVSGESQFRENEESKILEGIVGIHLSNSFNDIYYLETKNGKEVDFVYKNIGIEVKSGNKKINKLHYDKGYLLSRNDMPAMSNDKVSIPISVFLYLISSKNKLN